MRRYPTGVSVVGADADGDRLAITVGSLASVSLQPPLVSVAIGKELALHELLRSAGAFGASLLRGDQGDVAGRFARGMPPIALWENVALRGGVTGAPLLADALGWIECRVWSEVDAGDHTLFLGEVVALEAGEPGPALVYREQGYHSM
jgi:flavin reductase (DIM6/NTAB) family NADH-FMN oxidoreductase RutF